LTLVVDGRSVSCNQKQKQSKKIKTSKNKKKKKKKERKMLFDVYGSHIAQPNLAIIVYSVSL